MDVIWRSNDDGWETDPVVPVPGSDEHFVLRVGVDDTIADGERGRYQWSVDFFEDSADTPPAEAMLAGTAPLLAYAKRNAIAALLELVTGRRGRMVEHDHSLHVPALRDLQDAMWDVFTQAGKGGARQRASIDGWAKLAHQALVRLDR